MPIMRTRTDRVNLRRAPEIAAGNVLANLPLAHPVTVLATSAVSGFVPVETTVGGASVRGFIAAKTLRDPVGPRTEAMIEEAVKQWIRFKRGAGKETVDPFFRFVGEFWAPLQPSLDGRDTDVPWSAAFISHLAREAGLQGFQFSSGHWRYILQAKDARDRDRPAAPFWLFRLDEHRPRLGDLVCLWRVKPRTFDNLPRDGFKSHTDLVVEVRPGFVRTLGGNVGDSVNQKTFLLDDGGFLAHQRELFAIMRNNESVA